MADFDVLVERLSDFMVPLRMGEDLNSDTYERAKRALAVLAPFIRTADSLTKDLVRVLIDVYPQVQGLASLRKEDEAAVLLDWAEDLLAIIHELLDSA